MDKNAGWPDLPGAHASGAPSSPKIILPDGCCGSLMVHSILSVYVSFEQCGIASVHEAGLKIFCPVIRHVVREVSSRSLWLVPRASEYARRRVREVRPR